MRLKLKLAWGSVVREELFTSAAQVAFLIGRDVLAVSVMHMSDQST